MWIYALNRCFSKYDFFSRVFKGEKIFNDNIFILQIQSNECLHKCEIMMCGRILISCKEKKSELIEEICRPCFRTEVVILYATE